MYFLTIRASDEILRDRVPFEDYAEALEACGEFYEPNSATPLNFTSVVTRKKFMRSYAQLMRLADLGEMPHDAPPAVAAIKQGNAFTYSRSYLFMVESEEGVREAERLAREDDE